MKLKNLSIVILNFNSGEYLTKCLESVNNVRDEANISAIVIDNNSFDESLKIAQEKFKELVFVKNKQNLGFSKAYNKVLKTLKNEFILLLNPDCILERGVIKKVLEDFETQEKAGAVTCEIVLPDGKIDLTAHRGFPTPMASLMYMVGNNSKYHLTDKLSKEIHEVDAITGAFFMTKKSILDEVEYLDENFFLYGEDIDLSLRIKQKGYKILYDPTVKITHYKGISSGLKKHSQELSKADIETRMRARDAFYESMILFYNKHYKNKYPFFISWMVFSGIYTKWMLAKLRNTV